MFCKNCGKEIKDSATFCPYCGTNTGNTSANPTVQPATQSVVFPNMGKWIKAFFSKQIVNNLEAVAKDTSLTGLVGLIFEICAVAMYLALVPVKTISSVSSFFGGGSFGDSFGRFFSGLFGQFFFVAFIVLALLAVLYIVLAINHKKVGIKQVLNLMFYSLLPLGVVFAAGFVCTLLSMIFGLLIIMVFMGPAYLMTVILLYKGFNKLDTFENEPFYSFTLCSMLFTLFVFIILVVYASIGISSAVSNVSRGLGDLGDLFDSFKYYY